VLLLLFFRIVFVDIVCCAQESTSNSQTTSTATGDGVVNRSPVESDDSALIYGVANCCYDICIYANMTTLAIIGSAICLVILIVVAIVLFVKRGRAQDNIDSNNVDNNSGTFNTQSQASFDGHSINSSQYHSLPVNSHNGKRMFVFGVVAVAESTLVWQPLDFQAHECTTKHLLQAPKSNYTLVIRCCLSIWRFSRFYARINSYMTLPPEGAVPSQYQSLHHNNDSDTANYANTSLRTATTAAPPQNYASTLAASDAGASLNSQYVSLT
jgi:hypothetical protein